MLCAFSCTTFKWKLNKAAWNPNQPQPFSCITSPSFELMIFCAAKSRKPPFFNHVRSMTFLFGGFYTKKKGQFSQKLVDFFLEKYEFSRNLIVFCWNNGYTIFLSGEHSKFHHLCPQHTSFTKTMEPDNRILPWFVTSIFQISKNNLFVNLKMQVFFWEGRSEIKR